MDESHTHSVKQLMVFNGICDGYTISRMYVGIPPLQNAYVIRYLSAGVGDIYMSMYPIVRPGRKSICRPQPGRVTAKFGDAKLLATMVNAIALHFNNATTCFN